jgi:hypothetical protein
MKIQISILALLILGSCGPADFQTNEAQTPVNCVAMSDDQFSALQGELHHQLVTSPEYDAAVTFVTNNLPAILNFVGAVSYSTNPSVRAEQTIGGEQAYLDTDGVEFDESRRFYIQGTVNFWLTVDENFETWAISFGFGDSSWNMKLTDFDRVAYDFAFDLPYASATYSYIPHGVHSYTLAATTPTSLTAQRTLIDNRKATVLAATRDGEAVCHPEGFFWPAVLPFPSKELHIEEIAFSFSGIHLNSQLHPIELRIPPRAEWSVVGSNP